MHKEEKTKKSFTNKSNENIIIKEEKKDNKQGRKRSRWFSIVLYPDNSYHVDFMTYLQNKKKGYDSEFQGFYIYHTPEKNEKKAHWHLILYFPNERSVKGVCQMFGVGNYYLDSNGNYRAVFDLTGFPDNIKIEEKPNVTPVICQAVSDIHSMYQYLLHRNYASYLEGKKVYDRKDIKYINHDFQIVQAVAEPEKKIALKGEELQKIMFYIKTESLCTMSSLIRFLYINGEGCLIEYIEKHAYLVKSLLRG